MKKTKNNQEKNQGKNTAKLIPLGDRILIKPMTAEEVEKKSSSGIIIPDTISKEKPERGTVIAVGAGKFEDGKRIPVSVEVGDKVIFSRYGFEEVKIDEEEFYIINESNILAIIK